MEFLDDDPSKNSDIQLINFENPDEPITILSLDAKEDLKLRSWELSPDGSYILFKTAINYEPKPIFRHSEEANYALYHLESG